MPPAIFNYLRKSWRNCFPRKFSRRFSSYFHLLLQFFQTYLESLVKEHIVFSSRVYLRIPANTYSSYTFTHFFRNSVLYFSFQFLQKMAGISIRFLIYSNNLYLQEILQDFLTSREFFQRCLQNFTRDFNRSYIRELYRNTLFLWEFIRKFLKSFLGFPGDG